MTDYEEEDYESRSRPLAAPQSQPICADPPADLLMSLAEAIDEARDAYLDAFEGGQAQGNAKAVLESILWNDKGTFAPALRQAAQAAALTARVSELERLGQFLVDRLDEFDPGEDEPEREYHGHVAPALARFRDALLPTAADVRGILGEARTAAGDGK